MGIGQHCQQNGQPQRQQLQALRALHNGDSVHWCFANMRVHAHSAEYRSAHDPCVRPECSIAYVHFKCRPTASAPMAMPPYS